MAEVPLDFQHQGRRPQARFVGLPAEQLLGERMHAGRGLPGPDGPEYGDAGVQAPLRDGEPGGVGDLPDGDRMMEFPDHDSGAGIVGLQGPIRKHPQGGEAPGSGLEKHPPH